MALPSNLRNYLEAVRERVERRVIRRALAELGTVAKAAVALGTNRSHLHGRMARLGILSPRAQRKADAPRVAPPKWKRTGGPLKRRYELPPPEVASGAGTGDESNTARTARR